MLNSLSGLLIITGSIMVLGGMVQYRKLLQSFNNLKYKKDFFISYGPKLNLVMMWIFFIGYIYMGVSIGLKTNIRSEILIGVLSLLVGVFVYFVIKIQTEMFIFIENSNLESIKGLVSAIEARDQYTRGHSEHVANLVEKFHEYLPKKYKDKINVDRLKVAGLLHDIGKIGISENILNKKGKLTDEEYEKIKQHPAIGQRILLCSSQLSDVADWIYFHHEKIDGTGYYRFTDKEIPLESKLISIADVFSAVFTNRIYRKGMSYDESIEVLKSCAGKELDKELVEIFCSININDIVRCQVNVDDI